MHPLWLTALRSAEIQLAIMQQIAPLGAVVVPRDVSIPLTTPVAFESAIMG
jgi:hypothetical protein